TEGRHGMALGDSLSRRSDRRKPRSSMGELRPEEEREHEHERGGGGGGGGEQQQQQHEAASNIRDGDYRHAEHEKRPSLARCCHASPRLRSRSPTHQW
ncbi:hypothetical protein KEM56_001114, partial [Ascosphaera pollenicola]